jgi:hypothetical protein
MKSPNSRYELLTIKKVVQITTERGFLEIKERGKD